MTGTQPAAPGSGSGVQAMPTLNAVAAALRTVARVARWLAADREAHRRTRRILARWERASGRPAAQREPPPPARPRSSLT